MQITEFTSQGMSMKEILKADVANKARLDSKLWRR